jgi:hypothetical protein
MTNVHAEKWERAWCALGTKISNALEMTGMRKEKKRTNSDQIFWVKESVWGLS